LGTVCFNLMSQLFGTGFNCFECVSAMEDSSLRIGPPLHDLSGRAIGDQGRLHRK
jgi:cytochrome c2